jgi:hypothetical protein
MASDFLDIQEPPINRVNLETEKTLIAYLSPSRYSVIGE